MKTVFALLCMLAQASATAVSPSQEADVKVDFIKQFPGNDLVTKDFRYSSHVTLSIEADDGTLTPSGWSTRKVWKLAHGAERGSVNMAILDFEISIIKMLFFAWSDKPI